MRENLRRPLLFLITVGTGSLIILVDAPVEVIVAGTVLAGFLALIITGALDLADLKPSRLRRALRERPKAPETKKPDAAAKKPSLIRKLAPAGISLPGMLGTLTASIRETIAHARAPEGEKKNRIESIDAMLDQAVDGAAPGQPEAHTTDPLASLADLDLDSLADLDLDGDLPGPGTAFEPDQISPLSGEEADAVSEILKAHQSDLDGPDFTGGPAATLPSIAAGAPGLPGGGGMPDMSALSEELSELDGLDLDDIEIEGEEEEVDAGEPGPGEVTPEEPEEELEEDFDMVSFASGGTVDDDLITAIKADTKKKKFVEDVSLIRELKGEKYGAKDLAAELEGILAAMRSQR
ncbi:hypothetical protein [Methanoculleus sp. UBA303]|uniref:hypothetical protein n=1 Tax=Methanoculleus sp. UBA303 TaxID=1915497 RepID=UPI0025CC2742|nr:hypothetical protein [Methanoculleus sp. UBA303]